MARHSDGASGGLTVREKRGDMTQSIASVKQTRARVSAEESHRRYLRRLLAKWAAEAATVEVERDGSHCSHLMGWLSSEAGISGTQAADDLLGAMWPKVASCPKCKARRVRAAQTVGTYTCDACGALWQPNRAREVDL